MEKNNVKRLPWGNTEIQTLAEKLVTIAMVTTAARRQAAARAEQEAPAPLRNIGKRWPWEIQNT